jgi:hypothetical protein
MDAVYEVILLLGAEGVTDNRDCAISASLQQKRPAFSKSGMLAAPLTTHSVDHELGYFRIADNPGIE